MRSRSATAASVCRRAATATATPAVRTSSARISMLTSFLSVPARRLQTQAHHHLDAGLQRALIDGKTRIVVWLRRLRSRGGAHEEVRARNALEEEGEVLRTHRSLPFDRALGTEKGAGDFFDHAGLHGVVDRHGVAPDVPVVVGRARAFAGAFEDAFDALGHRLAH